MAALTFCLAESKAGPCTHRAAGCHSSVAIHNSTVVAGLFSCRGKSFGRDQAAASTWAACNQAIQLLVSPCLTTRPAACRPCMAGTWREIRLMVNLGARAPVGSTTGTDKFSMAVLSPLLKPASSMTSFVSSKDLSLSSQ